MIKLEIIQVKTDEYGLIKIGQKVSADYEPIERQN